MNLIDRLAKKVADKLGREELTAKLSSLEARFDNEFEGLTRIVNELKAGQGMATDIIRVLYEQPDQKRDELSRLRVTKEYEALFSIQEPLVSVRIATYNNAKLLAERALASVLRQTYEHYEVVVVGDRCSDDTEDVIKMLNNKKIRFYNLPDRGRYPEDPHARWMVAGTIPMNMGAELAKGTWIAPLDDDDEFTDDHIQVLLAECLKNRVELSYGKFRWHSDDEEKVLGAFPPRQGNFAFQATIYASALRYFQYDMNAWVFNEPADWNLCRRMYEAGVRMNFLDEIVAEIYYTRQAERKGSVTIGTAASATG